MKYNKKIVEKICNLIKADSYTLGEICNIVGIETDTFRNWKRKHPEFVQAIEKAHDEARESFLRDARKSLRDKLNGKVYEEPKNVYVANPADPQRSILKERSITKKFVPPDTAAIIFTLCNMDPEHWKNRNFNELVGKDGKDLFADMSDEDLDKRIKALEEKMGK